jgi:uncharacterized protein YggT (Ycf19 family)
MAKKPTDSKSMFIKFARALTYLVYAYLVTAVSFLITGFVLLLLGASQDAAFVKFVYNIAGEFLQPFRGMFPPQQITDRGYFSAAGFFAIIMYALFAAAIHALIGYITLKQAEHQQELIELQQEAEYAAAKPPRPPAEHPAPPRPAPNGPARRVQ